MTKKITFCSLMALFGIISLILSNFIQSNTIFLYLFSTMFTYISMEEYGVKYGFLTYAVIALTGFIFVTNKVSIGAYALIIGYYPIIKHIVEHFNVGHYVKWVIKIVFILLISIFAYIMLKQLIITEIPVGLILPVGVVIFVIYDVVLTMGIKFYALRIRKFK